MMKPVTRSRWSGFAAGIGAFLVLTAAASQEASSYDPEEGGLIPDIVLAARRQDHARIAALLAQGADPTVLSGSTSDKPGPSAWVWAVLLQDNQSLQMLLQHTGALDKAPMAGFGLAIAVTNRNSEAVHMLLDHGIPVDLRPFDGATPLLLAAGNGDIATLRLLLKRGADVNVMDPHGDTPLMAAVRAGPADAVRALLEAGANPDPRDQRGRSAAQWAARYGRQDLSNLLGMKGAAARGSRVEWDPGKARLTAREAALRSLPLLQRGAASWTERAVCVSCHHQYLMGRTVAVARRQGFPLDEGLLHVQEAVLKQDRDHLLAMIKPALTDEAAMARVTARSGRPTFEVAYSLAALSEDTLHPDDCTAALAQFLARAQEKDGHWWVGLPRIPLASSDITMTACAMRALQAYAPSTGAEAMREKARRAGAWLERAPQVSTEDKVFRLRGLQWAGAGRGLIEAAVNELKQQQNRDGGWGQMPRFNSDAYATGEALVALRECGDVAASDSAFQRGIQYLLQTQEPDGSWLVHKRAVAFNGYLESGFPHGKFQITSFAGTCWATMALMLADPPPARRSDR